VPFFTPTKTLKNQLYYSPNLPKHPTTSYLINIQPPLDKSLKMIPIKIFTIIFHTNSIRINNILTLIAKGFARKSYYCYHSLITRWNGGLSLHYWQIMDSLSWQDLEKRISDSNAVFYKFLKFQSLTYDEKPKSKIQVLTTKILKRLIMISVVI